MTKSSVLINGVETAVPADAVAYKYADPTEDARWLYDEAEASDIARIDPGLIVRPTPRYFVAPIATADCNSIDDSAPVLQTSDLAEAKEAASHGPYAFGCGILDTNTGKLDVGFGFGVPCPDFVEEG